MDAPKIMPRCLHNVRGHTCLLVALLMSVTVLVLAGAASARSYTVTDLGTLGGPTSEAEAINDAGEVTGTADTSYSIGEEKFAYHAFRYRDEEMTDLTPGEPQRPPGGCNGCSNGYAINSIGDVAGSQLSLSGDRHAIAWKADGSTWDVPNPDAGKEARAFGIDAADEVVGGVGRFNPIEGDEGSAWLTDSGGTTTALEFESPPSPKQGVGSAFAINDRGEVVGVSFNGLASHAFLYRAGKMHDLGTLGGTTSLATAINAGGEIVGYSEITESAGEHAFLYRHHTMIDLGTLAGSEESEAYAINDHGIIVGSSGSHAFIYRKGAMIDLNSLLPAESGWTLTTASGINDSGEIVGTGLYDGVQRGFVLTPTGGHS
jgi:probable HAF family extracellular repeat protein